MLHRLFKLVLADLETRRDQQGVLLLAFIVVLVGRADIAGEVRHRSALGVKAREGAKRRDSGQLGEADGDGGIFLEGEVLGHRHGLVALRVLELLLDALDLVWGELEQFGEGAEDAVRLLEAVGDQVDPEIGTVDGDGLVVAVDDPAAPGRHQPRLHPVRLGEKLVFLVLLDREVGHARAERRRHQALRAAEDERAAGEGEDLAVLRQERFLRPSHRASRHRSSPTTIRATRG